MPKFARRLTHSISYRNEYLHASKSFSLADFGDFVFFNEEDIRCVDALQCAST